MTGSSGANERSLSYTPSWAIATVVAVFIAISFLLMRGIESLEKLFIKASRRAFLDTLLKMKEELMLLGFMSLLLTVCQNSVASICVKSSALDRFAVCKITNSDETPTGAVIHTNFNPPAGNGSHSRRSILQYVNPFITSLQFGSEPLFRRALSESNPGSKCHPGYESFVSTTGLHQLHILIFVLAIVHVFYSASAMGLAMLQVHSWKSWEAETQEKHANTFDKLNALTRSLTVQRQSKFLEYHTSKRWSRNGFSVWVICFFRQFGQSVTRADYLTLRLGFIKTHNLGLKFDFHSYMIRSMEDEFKIIVGISAALWAFVVTSLLFNVSGSHHIFFYMSFIPPFTVFVIGCKLQHVISTLALEMAGMQNTKNFKMEEVVGTINPRDELFWFKKPGFVLWVIHFILFQNAFELATFIWFSWQLDDTLTTCFVDRKYYIYIRVVAGLLTLFLCSYSTLPLYALVTQMGSNYKKTLLSDSLKKKLHIWRKNAKRNVKQSKLKKGDSSSTASSRTTTNTDNTSSSLRSLSNFSGPGTDSLGRNVSFNRGSSAMDSEEEFTLDDALQQFKMSLESHGGASQQKVDDDAQTTVDDNAHSKGDDNAESDHNERSKVDDNAHSIVDDSEQIIAATPPIREKHQEDMHDEAHSIPTKTRTENLKVSEAEISHCSSKLSI